MSDCWSEGQLRECWSEGQLRAYIDRELPAEEVERVAAHLEECSECGDLWAELAGRADRVSALMRELGEPEPVVAPGRKPFVRRSVRRWAGAAALAAGVMLGTVAFHRHATEVAVAPPASPPAVVQSAAGIPHSPAAETAHSAVALAPARPARSVSSRSIRKPAASGLPDDGPFLALDDDPIESGVVWRVELGPRAVPAEVVVDSDGRPRAIRLVNFKPNQ
jgi:anti-sigma factor RsiW